MRIGLRYTKLVRGSVGRIIPDSAGGGLLLKDVDEFAMSLCPQMPEPSSAQLSIGNNNMVAHGSG